MLRYLIPIVALAASCKSDHIATIENAEAYAQAHGVTLSQKKTNEGQLVAQRSYLYKTTTGVDVAIFQFASSDAATSWRETMDKIPLGREIRVQKDATVFAAWGDSDTERQKVVDALK